MTKRNAQAGTLAEARVAHIPLDAVVLADDTFKFRAIIRVGNLKKSIEADGQQVPIIVRKQGDSKTTRYQIISGFRRTTAMTELGLATIAAIVREDLDDDEKAFRASVLENTARKTYSDIDRAIVLQTYKQRGWKTNDIAEVMGLKRRQTQLLQGLLDLPEAVQAAIDENAKPFTATHGVSLKQLANKHDLDDDAVEGWVDRVVADELSVAQMKRAINKDHKPSAPARLSSIFRENGTDESKGVFRLQPVKVEVAKLSADDKAALREELESLLGALD